jgi:hypothetical protein
MEQAIAGATKLYLSTRASGCTSSSRGSPAGLHGFPNSRMETHERARPLAKSTPDCAQVVTSEITSARSVRECMFGALGRTPVYLGTRTRSKSVHARQGFVRVLRGGTGTRCWARCTVSLPFRSSSTNSDDVDGCNLTPVNAALTSNQRSATATGGRRTGL